MGRGWGVALVLSVHDGTSPNVLVGKELETINCRGGRESTGQGVSIRAGSRLQGQAAATERGVGVVMHGDDHAIHAPWPLAAYRRGLQRAV